MSKASLVKIAHRTDKEQKNRSRKLKKRIYRLNSENTMNSYLFHRATFSADGIGADWLNQYNKKVSSKNNLQLTSPADIAFAVFLHDVRGENLTMNNFNNF